MKAQVYKIIGIVFFVLGLLVGTYIYFVSFALWYDWLGFFGYIVASFFAPDIILIVKQIIDNGFLDRYFLMTIGGSILIFFASVFGYLSEKYDEN